MQEFARAAAKAVGRAVPFEGICVLALDPATLLPTAEHVEHGLPARATARLTEIEFREPDFNKFTALARRVQPAASLSQATAGKLDRSLRQRELRRPGGFGDELRAALSDANGTWGALTLLREAGSPRFTSAEVAFPHLGGWQSRRGPAAGDAARRRGPRGSRRHRRFSRSRPTAPLRWRTQPAIAGLTRSRRSTSPAGPCRRWSGPWPPEPGRTPPRARTATAPAPTRWGRRRHASGAATRPGPRTGPAQWLVRARLPCWAR